MSPASTLGSRRRRYRSALHHIESLETRTLFTGITGIAPGGITPDAGNYPTTGAFDANGHFWYANPQNNSMDQIDDSGNVTASIPLPTDAVPSGPDLNELVQNMVLAPNGHIFYVDGNYSTLDGNVEAIVDFNPAGSGSFTFHALPDSVHTPPPNTNLAVTTDGAVWFTGANGSIGRLDTSGSWSFLDSTDSGTPFHVAASGDAVFVTLGGTNSVGQATYDNSTGDITLGATWTADSGNSSANTDGLIQNIVVAADGSLYYDLANVSGTSGDYIIHSSSDGSSQQGYLVPGSDTATAGTTALALDGAGHLLFSQLIANGVGYFDTNTLSFTTYSYATDLDPQSPAGDTGFTSQVVVNSDPAATTAWAVNSQGFPLVRVDLPPASVSFSGQAFPVAGTENIAITMIPLAAFTGVSGQTYTASITWGDNTTTTVTAQDLGDNQFAIVVPTKTFAAQGSYNGTVTILASDNSQWGSLTFTSTISDTPLSITSDTVTNLGLRIVLNTFTFTDDANSTAGTFTATINWGDGTTSRGLIVRDPTTPGKFFVLSLHQYKRKGGYTVTSTVTTSEVGASPTSVSAVANIVV